MSLNLSSISLNPLGSNYNSGGLPVYKPGTGWVIDFSGSMNFSGGSTNVDPSALFSALNGALTWNILTDVDRNGASEFGPVITPSLLAASSNNVTLSGATTATVNFTL